MSIMELIGKEIGKYLIWLSKNKISKEIPNSRIYNYKIKIPIKKDEKYT